MNPPDLYTFSEPPAKKPGLDNDRLAVRVIATLGVVGGLAAAIALEDKDVTKSN